MKPSDFHFELPEELIAHYPAASRSGSRLLTLDRASGGIAHRQFRDFPTLLRPGDLLVFNDTRVLPARLFGRKRSGGGVEVLLERVLAANEVLAQVRANRPLAAGTVLEFGAGAGTAEAEVRGRSEGFYRLRFATGVDLSQLLEKLGHMPLPPYIRREDETLDRERYQTVYARRGGAVAAPTAGLHFDDDILRQISAAGIDSCFVTLHVGAGTFQPVRTERVEEHTMHAEYLEVPAAVCAQVEACKARGGRVVAVGTTSVRCLETASADGALRPFAGDTRIFIYPGYRFRTVDALLTNFHLPQSTLLMLVSAFSSREKVLAAYAEAIRERYRFYSYGDAMFIA